MDVVPPKESCGEKTTETQKKTRKSKIERATESFQAKLSYLSLRDLQLDPLLARFGPRRARD